MELFEKVDEKRVIREVRAFFFHDGLGEVTYAKIEREANIMLGLTGLSGDVTGIRGSAKGNSAEERLLNADEYYRAYNGIKIAIKSCHYPSDVILDKRYLKHWVISKVMAELNLSGNASYSSADHRAIFEFVEVIAKIKSMLNISDQVIPDFTQQKSRAKVGQI
ncbi:hypothetical protein [Lactobacillus sp. 3B(2020)]|uniref:hypothetical protein n=1 Tax=Lactobacillus sp. 3B(2020) TaxID=2695882 RepID=UPI0015DF8043|nr:hypothetical protein [Lactobacillus sp. 3B(2020)]QLL69585.1 hypothetical protein GTO83_03025 [Lactobacillus sp. 3B(2020)]